MRNEKTNRRARMRDPPQGFHPTDLVRRPRRKTMRIFVQILSAFLLGEFVAEPHDAGRLFRLRIIKRRGGALAKPWRIR